MITITIITSTTTQVAAYVGITNIFLLWLFISALAPVSGGHINPIITFATFLAGLTKFSRAVLYLIGQIAGAALAGGLIRGSLGEERTAA
jgi:glycerol uptake facilitator-like aquaporin